MMKLIPRLSIFLSALFLGACATTPEKATAPVVEEEPVVEEKTSTSVRLMDRYKSGEIPGYRD
ncbi:MAG: hypothetical protein AAF546_12380 [Verrucomicrobiota bacterium]